MIIRKAIRDLHSNKNHQKRFCDVVINNENKIYLEWKENKKYKQILWNDVVQQVEIAKELCE